MMKALIIEDDPFSVEMLRDLLHDCDPSLKIMDDCSTVDAAVEKIRKYKPEIVFLDVELTDGTGFDVLKTIGTIDFEIIFTTSHDKYALDAIKYSAVDYLVKPVKETDLKIALKKIKKRIPQEQSKIASRNQPRLIDKVALPTLEGLSFVPIQEIVRIESDRNYTIFYLIENRELVVTKSLKNYEELLNDHGFIRIHHSHLINVNHLVKYVRGAGGYVVLSDNTTVNVARRRKDNFLNQLDKA